MSVYNVAYKYNGTVAQAAVQIASVVQNLAVNFGMGIGLACGIMITNAIGAGDRERAVSYSRKCPKIGIAICVVVGVVLAIYADDISHLFRISDEARLYAQYMIYVVAVATVLKTLNYIYIIGILRSGGDTKFCLLLDAGTVWCIGVPMAFLGAKVLGLPIYITFAMVYTEELVKVFIAHARIKKNKWANKIV
jgi:Na+-driven multidrug efflux pump